LARTSALDCLSVSRHSELELAGVLFVLLLRLVALLLVVVVCLFLVIFSDLLRLDDAHADAEEASAAQEKLTRLRVLGDVGSAEGIARRPAC
jgi:flagellar basal body-associated protein FliL